MRNLVNVSKLGTSLAKIYARSASAIFAADDSCFYEPAVLFQSDQIGFVLTIELDKGDLLFETANLAKAIEFVTATKGRCDFSMSHDGIVFKEEDWPEQQETDEEPNDDRDSADWWKRGQQ